MTAVLSTGRLAGWVQARIAGHLGWWPADSISELQSGRKSCRVTYSGRTYRVIVPASATSTTKPIGA